MLTSLQITGARIPITLIEGDKSYEFLMSPLTDIDSAELDLWLQCKYIRDTVTPATTEAEYAEIRRISKTLSAFAGAGLDMVDNVEGVARFCWQSINKNHPEIKYSTLKYLMSFAPNKAEFNEKFQTLNEVEYLSKPAKPAAEPANGEKPKPKEKIDRGIVYAMLAQMYNYTFAEIAAMTPLQQLTALTQGKSTGKRERYFNTYEEYQKWLTTRI